MLLALNSGENDRMSIGSLTANHIPAYNDGLVCANRQHSAVLGYSIAMLGENGAWIEASIPPLPILYTRGLQLVIAIFSKVEFAAYAAITPVGVNSPSDEKWSTVRFFTVPLTT